MPEDTFTCSVCEETFGKAITEEEAEAELAKNYPGVKKEYCEVLCGRCFDRCEEWLKNDRLRSTHH